jgi:hypothetical protein
MFPTKKDWVGWLLNLVESLPSDFSLVALRYIRYWYFLWQRETLSVKEKEARVIVGVM